MSRDTNMIKRLTLFDSCDLTAAEEYFAKMAEEGWMINKYSLFSEFVRCEPRSLRFSVQLILPEKQSPEYSEKVRGYTELCEQAGWKLAASKGGMFIFASEDPDIPEVVTDPEERIEAATRQSRIGLFVIWFVVLASILPVLGPCMTIFNSFFQVLSVEILCRCPRTQLPCSEIYSICSHSYRRIYAFKSACRC